MDRGKKQCNCKNSRCLKLYCECFASGRYCDGCNCANCFNNRENEHTRQSAVEAILERNPNAFRPKIQEEVAVVPRHVMPALDTAGKHSKGCNCKKSACLKKYCECFQAGVFCSDACKCVECKNYEGSEQRAQVIACLNMQPGGFMEASSPVSMSMSPMKRARSGSGPGVFGTLPGALANPTLAAAAAALAARGGLPGGLMSPAPGLGLAAGASPQARPILHQTVGDLINSNVIERTCQLLLLVADEEAENPQVLAAAAQAADDDEGARATKQRRLQDAQERAVLEEFLNTFKRMVDTAHKKAAAIAAGVGAFGPAGGALSALLGSAGAAPLGLPPGLAAAGAALGRLPGMGMGMGMGGLGQGQGAGAAGRPPLSLGGAAAGLAGAGIPLAAAGYQLGHRGLTPSPGAGPPAVTAPGLASRPPGPPLPPVNTRAGGGGSSWSQPADQDAAQQAMQAFAGVMGPGQLQRQGSGGWVQQRPRQQLQAAGVLPLAVDNGGEGMLQFLHLALGRTGPSNQAWLPHAGDGRDMDQ